MSSGTSAILFLRYNENASYVLTDFELLTVIKLRIIYNTRFMTYKKIKEGLWEAFAGAIDIITTVDTLDVWFDFTRYNGSPASNGFGKFSDYPSYNSFYFYRYRNYKNMEITYKVENAYFNAFEAAKFLNIIPCSMGVAINTQYV